MFTPELDLRAIQIFLAVAEGKSVKKASEKLKISSPAISQALKLLEEDLGTELFCREVRPLRLTASGRKLQTEGINCPFTQKQNLLKRVCFSVASLRYRRKCNVNHRTVPTGFIKKQGFGDFDGKSSHCSFSREAPKR